MSQFWLMKSEPSTFDMDDLKKCPRSTDAWDGVRNYQARNYIKSMHTGDLAFFYYSNCKEPGIAGLVEIVSEPYPDKTALISHSPYYDIKSTQDNPRWYVVDVKFKKKFKSMISLKTIKAHPEILHLPLIKKGSRLSVMPVNANEWQHLLKLKERIL